MRSMTSGLESEVVVRLYELGYRSEIRSESIAMHHGMSYIVNEISSRH